MVEHETYIYPYDCICCGDEWKLEIDKEEVDGFAYQDLCPLCNMPLTQMMKDVYPKEGIKGVTRLLWKRLKYKIKT